MNIYDIKALTPEERASVIDSESVGTEETSYMRLLSAEELIEWRQKFTQLAIAKAEIDDEFDKVKEQFKAKLKPLGLDLSYSLGVIKSRGEWTKGNCHLMPDYDNKIMHIIDDEGNVINSRMLRPEERQFRITPNQKAS